ncbi:unnamed protein product [Adineta steineri]|uniref:Uncharacterized protein n=1 Tax=Adineta steineri TaxID=433720 RepID=A0A815N5G6_9BILA|nr:unnamed protein product [Adineta steineri]CAF3937120.1 unnamed protein product [Adineta steineri]
MSFLLIFFILPYLCTSSYPYGLIRNASIKISFDMNDDHGYILKSQDCNQCLCSAFSNPKVVLFTCTQNESINVTCQFYYFMPIRDEIQYPNVYTNIYLIQTNETFEEKDDCCNTTTLISKIKEALRTKETATNKLLRSLSNDDNNTIITVQSSTGILLKFDKSTLKPVDTPEIPGLTTAGYYDGYYYLGIGKNIYVYNKSLSTPLHEIPNKGDAITVIRFIDNTQEMIVGTLKNGVHICGKDIVKGYLINCKSIPPINIMKQVHAIGIVNENAFYVGWFDPDLDIHLYTRNPSDNTWTTNPNDKINHSKKTSDIIIDNCKRIWAVVPETDTVIIYDQNKNHLGEINDGGTNLFNLMIAENYTLIMSHEFKTGLTRIKPDLNCRPLR